MNHGEHGEHGEELIPLILPVFPVAPVAITGLVQSILQRRISLDYKPFTQLQTDLVRQQPNQQETQTDQHARCQTFPPDE